MVDQDNESVLIRGLRLPGITYASCPLDRLIVGISLGLSTQVVRECSITFCLAFAVLREGVVTLDVGDLSMIIVVSVLRSGKEMYPGGCRENARAQSC